jgi:hypothetical protein
MAKHTQIVSASRLRGILAVAVLAACAQKEEVPPPPPPTPNIVTVRASDFAYAIPAEIPAGFTTFRLVNDGPNLHHMVVARIDSGKTYDEAKTALGKHGPPPGWLVPVGGPNAPDPQAQSNATLDMKVGEYVVFCMVDIPGGVPHIAKGMINPLKVVAATGATAAAPNADVTMTLADYSFTLSKPLTAGSHTIAVTTSPGQPHEVEIIKFAPGKTMADFSKDMQLMMSGKPLPGPLSASAIGGVAPGVAGTTQYFTVDLTPGNYALLCFLPDAKDGKMHLEHGMVQQFTIQ